MAAGDAILATKPAVDGRPEGSKPMTDRENSGQLRAGIAATFDLAVRRHHIRDIGNQRDQKALEAIEGQHDALRQAEHDDYARNYDRRVKHAEAGIWAKRTRPMPRIKPPPGSAESSLQNLVRQDARKQVEQDHINRLTEIDRAEAKAYTAVLEDIFQRTAVKDRARDNFNRIVDRRSGPDRRVRQQRHT
ncbi:hypothetical protein [uncultured Hoeflea sp.]|uniref:hypothetical protein n=1 Tax=uncultured Hoeflea sp. TaxID=538666 RepID=UPI0026356929|nr:hypothetical protein [uncultured Hoeflea sp.]